MRDFFTALGLIWCLYNTWELRHNFKFDKMSNILDQATLKVLKIHCKRRALCKRKVRRNKKESVDDALTMFIKAQVESYPHSYFLRKGPREIEFRRR